jgi:hypothetical protein
MRVVLACLIVLGAFAGSALGFALWGASKVGAHVAIDTSCRLLDAAENDGLLTRSQRFDVIQRVAMSTKLAQPVRNAATRLRNGCAKQPPTPATQGVAP